MNDRSSPWAVAGPLTAIATVCLVASFLAPVEQWERDALQWAALFAGSAAPLQVMAQRRGVPASPRWTQTMIGLGVFYAVTGFGLALIVLVSVALTRMFDLPIVIGSIRGQRIINHPHR